MSMTDPVADLFSRINTALIAKRSTVEVPTSKLKVEIVRILTEEGYLESYDTVEAEPRGLIRIRLKYTPSGNRAIAGMRRVSRPGRRVYCGKDDIPRTLDGLGVSILSTPKGVMTGAASRKQGVGGEVLCSIW